MNVDAVKKVRDAIASNPDKKFNMGSCETCIMEFARFVFHPEFPTCTEGVARRALGLNDRQTWELFYVGSITSSARSLDSYTREETLAVLDKAIEDGSITEGLWAEVVG